MVGEKLSCEYCKARKEAESKSMQSDSAATARKESEFIALI